jgi:UDP-2,4-diacetamido-2,4,6-trideoxy-beta-L-altropyranose hydrolase
MRMIALGQGWQDRGGTVRVITAAPPLLRDRLVQEGFEVVELREPAPSAADAPVTVEAATAAEAVVVDGPYFGPTYQSAIRAARQPLLVVDDMASHATYDADLILNQNAHASELNYNADIDTERLFGLRYVLLRREFRSFPNRSSRDIRTRADHLVVTFGGADPGGMSLRVIEVLRALPDPPSDVVVIVGAANRRHRELQDAVNESAGRIHLLRDVRAMARTLSDRDLAISSGGSGVWELAFLGVPAIVVETATPERFLASGLRAIGLFEVLGPAAGLTNAALAEAVGARIRDAAWRRAMSDRGRDLIDGLGTDRVIGALKMAVTRTDLRHVS